MSPPISSPRRRRAAAAWRAISAAPKPASADSRSRDRGLRLSARRGRARAHEERERIAPLRLLLAGSPARAPPPSRRCASRSAAPGGVRGGGQTAPRPRVEAADEARLDEPVQAPGHRAPLARRRAAGRRAARPGTEAMSVRAPRDPQAQIVEPRLRSSRTGPPRVSARAGSGRSAASHATWEQNPMRRNVAREQVAAAFRLLEQRRLAAATGPRSRPGRTATRGSKSWAIRISQSTPVQRSRRICSARSQSVRASRQRPSSQAAMPAVSVARPMA